MDLPDQKKHILYIVTQSSPWGGAQRYVFDLAREFTQKGWRVTVAAGKDPDGELMQKLRDASIPAYHLQTLTRAVHPIKNILALFEIRALCKKIKPDIVHLNSSMAGVLGAVGARLADLSRDTRPVCRFGAGSRGNPETPKQKLRFAMGQAKKQKTKIIYTVHGLVTKEPLSMLRKTTYWCAEWIAGKFRDTTICVSEDDRRAVIAQHIASPGCAVTIPIGTNTSIPFLTREEARKALLTRHPPLHSPPPRGEGCQAPLPHKGEESGRPMGSSDDEDVWIGAIAGLYKTKGLATLIEALAQISPVIETENFQPLRCLIIGEGPERPRLQALIEKNQLTHSVFLLGAMADAANFLKAFDCFVLPSVKEGMPYTILEAQAAGIPIVATRVGGIPEIVQEDETHRLVSPRDGKAFTDAIMAIVTKEREQHPLPQKNSGYYTLAQMMARTATVYLQSRSPSR